ncbi:hypothetical protein [Sinomicrobium sp. M5D2P9]
MKRVLLGFMFVPLIGFSQNNTFPASGNVGIGTTSPWTTLSIYTPGGEPGYPTLTSKGDAQFILRSSNNDLEIGTSRKLNDRTTWFLARHSSITTYGQYYSTLHLQPDTGDKSRFKGVAIGYPAQTSVPFGTHLAIAGNVGIGTVNPGDWKLAVNGNIRAKEVKVETGWSDFVFEKTYKLPTLKEVEQYIEEHGHLKDIPSAGEVEKNGILVGEMHARLLQKIEELTLYTIQQQKIMEEQGKMINGLKEQIEKLTD